MAETGLPALLDCHGRSLGKARLSKPSKMTRHPTAGGQTPCHLLGWVCHVVAISSLAYVGIQEPPCGTRQVHRATGSDCQFCHFSLLQPCFKRASGHALSGASSASPSASPASDGRLSMPKPASILGHSGRPSTVPLSRFAHASSVGSSSPSARSNTSLMALMSPRSAMFTSSFTMAARRLYPAGTTVALA